jgi:TetR/AcrR family transcriptional regulator, transcriptional repressor for nem operon
MARTKEFDEAAVLDHAVDTFWEHGFDGTAVQDLCAAMGLNPGSLYGAFGDKRALFLAALDRYVDTVSGQALERIGSGHSGLTGIRSYFDYLIAAMLDGKRRWGCLITNSAAELALHDPDVAARVKLHLARIESAFASALARAHASGELAEGIGAQGATFLVCLVQGLNILAKTKPERQVLEGVVDFTLKALASPRSRTRGCGSTRTG